MVNSLFINALGPNSYVFLGLTCLILLTIKVGYMHLSLNFIELSSYNIKDIIHFDIFEIICFSDYDIIMLDIVNNDKYITIDDIDINFILLNMEGYDNQDPVRPAGDSYNNIGRYG